MVLPTGRALGTADGKVHALAPERKKKRCYGSMILLGSTAVAWMGMGTAAWMGT